MSQRIGNEQLAKLAHELANNPGYAGFVGPGVVIACILDLADARGENFTARTRIAELERLSASQSEAMDMMDRGAL